MLWTTEIIGERDEYDLKALYDASPFVKGDTRLRKPRIRFQLTNAEISEYLKCKLDILYFAQNYCTLFDTRLQMFAPIVLTDDQKDILTQKDKMTIHQSARQRGISTAYVILCLHRLTFEHEYFIYSLEPNINMCKHFVEMLMSYYKRLPFFMKIGIDTSNNMKLKFENGSRLVMAPATTNAFIGWSPTLFIANAFGLYESKACKMVWQSLIPCVYARSNAKLIIQNPIEQAGVNNPEFNLWIMYQRLNPSPNMVFKEYTTPMPNSIGMNGVPMTNIHSQCLKLVKQMMTLGKITPRELRQLAKDAE